MLTDFTKLYEKDFSFWIYGSEANPTEIYRFFDALGNGDRRKIVAVLDAINTNPGIYQHREKFKRLTGKLWEIKSFQIRVACYWHIGKRLLIGVYAFTKKKNDWPEGDLSRALKRHEECCDCDLSQEWAHEGD